MTSSPVDRPGPLSWSGGHATEVLLASYAAGILDTVAVWSVEAHLTGCAICRSALSAYADTERLARNRSAVLVRVALPDERRIGRLLGRCGIPDYLIDLVAVTPSLRVSWLLSVVGVLAVVAGEAAAAKYGWIRGGGYPVAAGYWNPGVLAPFLLVGPLLVLAGVAAAFLPMFDPGYQLALAAPFSGVRLLLVRTVSALIAALVPMAGAAFLVPGPGWLPVALLVPSLALCTFALAAATVVDARVAALTAGILWALPALLLAADHVPLKLVRPSAQLACAAVLFVSAVVLYLRHDRFELG